MIGTSIPEYVFIRICIVLVQYTTPLCIACLALLAAVRGSWAAALRHHPIITASLLAYCTVDVLYAVFLYLPHARRLKEAAEHPPPLEREERRALFQRCFANVPDVRRYLQMWFLGADEADIRRDNVHDFILWAFFDSWPGRESEGDDAELEEYIDIVEKRLGRKLEPGRGKAEGLRLTLDEVGTQYRSVAWYLAVGVVDFASHCLLAHGGFHYHAQPASTILSLIPPRFQDMFTRRRSESDGISYWHRPHTATDKLPVLFLHGIGIGLYTYAAFLTRLNSTPGVQNGDGQIGIIATENLPISFRLTGTPLSRLEFLERIATILDAHGWDRFVLASHSYGSVLATHMLRSENLTDRIAAVVLVDPVTILLHLPDVAYNFTRRPPKKANEWQLWYFASMDPGVAYCLGRHFFWKDNIVWKEELLGVAGGAPTGVVGGANDRRIQTNAARPPRKVAVCLAERDLIVDTPKIAQYLAAAGDEWVVAPGPAGRRGSSPWEWSVNQDGGSHLTPDGIELLWCRGLDHAQVFDTKENQDRLCSVIRRFCSIE
ncbi:hypothetical protein F4818DRAFT_450060 [Hypoxylon cercidicola]|nr:hypothetical protein F4818DRAFT_450060 [Hypoxylon cercidicola]